QVTDATGGMIRLRGLVSAATSGALWDLRCNVREALVEYLHDRHPAGLPRNRIAMVEQARAEDRRPSTGAREGLFSGSPEAEQRQAEFTQSTPIQRPPKDVEPD